MKHLSAEKVGGSTAHPGGARACAPISTKLSTEIGGILDFHPKINHLALIPQAKSQFWADNRRSFQAWQPLDNAVVHMFDVATDCRQRLPMLCNVAIQWSQRSLIFFDIFQKSRNVK
ncbi:hypothetical protein SDC9_142603 [bioreactor metagenome]|uniref:Uncharacterized protein n=1 Tax=bioreactor metagenome TaxID=1076179 RepID=A0A645E1L9_9ZZZZ